MTKTEATTVERHEGTRTIVLAAIFGTSAIVLLDDARLLIGWCGGIGLPVTHRTAKLPAGVGINDVRELSTAGVEPALVTKRGDVYVLADDDDRWRRAFNLFDGGAS